MLPIRVFAPAKINLALHVTGKRTDGYHLLDSLVAFAPVGDVLHVGHGDDLLIVDGPEGATVPANSSNLVARAVRHLLDACRLNQTLTLRLTKTLPVASGMGGGSSDAAAALRGAMALLGITQVGCRGGKLALARHGGEQVIVDLAELGADVPMCFSPAPARIRGIGEQSRPAPLPPLPAVLVNPRVQVFTPAVFRALTQASNAPMPDAVPLFTTAQDCIAWLADQRNDLQAPACAVAPVIGDVLGALAAQPGAGLARMSGSGATCFALFETVQGATAACDRLRTNHPDWWVAQGVLGDQTEASAAVMAG